MIKRLLLTGATGYLGSRLTNALLADGYEVIVLKRVTSSLKNIASMHVGLKLFDLETTDLKRMFEEIGVVDAVIHVAANYGRNGEGAEEIVEANLAFPLRLLEAAIAANVGLFLNTDTALDKYTNAYSLSKRQFTEWGGYFSKQGKILRFINLKLEHFFGPSDDAKKFTTYVIENCLTKTPELKLTSGEQRRDFIYVDDVIAAYMLLLKKWQELPDGFVEFDVGSGEAVSIRHFVELVHKLTNSTTKLNFGAIPYRKNEPMFLQADTSALRNLGWCCRYTLEQGLKMAIKGNEQ